MMLILSGCVERMNINVTPKSAVATSADTIAPSLTIDKAVNETVGNCSFISITDPTNLTGFSYRISFSEPIDVSSFTSADISNIGTGGSVTLDWELANCGDDKNFKLTARDVEGNGTIIPVVLGGLANDNSSNFNLPSTSTDNSVSFSRVWVQEAYIKAFNAQSSDYFGDSVYIDGETLAVSATGEDSNQTTITNGAGGSLNDSLTNSGAIYIYKRSGQTWSQEAYIKAANAGTGDDFGLSISLNRDTLAVGAIGESSNQVTITNGSTASSNNSAASSGAVYVYKRTGVSWIQEAYLKASNANAYDYFGRSVSAWGDYIAVGAHGEDSNQTTITNGAGASSDNTNTSSGAAYVFKRAGTTWVQDAYIKSTDTKSISYFGSSVSLDNDTLAVGAYQGNGANGEVSVFKRSVTGWALEREIQAVNEFNFNQFGLHVSLSKDTLAVSAPYEKSNQNTITNGASASGDTSFRDSGAVYVYKRSGTTWGQEAYIKSSNNDEDDLFGHRVGLDGDTLVVSTVAEDSNSTTILNGQTSSLDNSAAQSGAVYVYRRKNSSWAQEAYIKASNSEAGDYFGDSVSVSGDTIVVGSSLESSNQTTITNGTTASADNSQFQAGAVYVYRYNGRLLDVTDVWGSSTSSSITLNWHRTGGLATNYLISHQMGTTAPADCSSGTVIDAGDVNTFTELALSPGTYYSFRVCAADGTDVTTGSTVTLSTL